MVLPIRKDGGDLMAKDEENLRSKDVAYLLDCSPDEVVKLVRYGKLRAEKVGKFWKFSFSEVQKYKRENSKEK